MSILTLIEEAKAAGNLIPHKSSVPWPATPRAFLMCKPVFEKILAGRASDNDKDVRKWAAVEAAMSVFIEGGKITEDLIKQLLPPSYEHWELRCRKPKPSLRMFGRFAHPDIFVGTHIVQRTELGGMWSKEFEHHKLVCEDHWNDAGLCDPFTDAPEFRYEKYITDNASKTRGIAK
jgi:hypothetical protein